MGEKEKKIRKAGEGQSETERGDDYPVDKHKILLVVMILFLGIAVAVGSQFVPAGIDWNNSFRPATQAFIHAANPYTLGGIFNPPWLFAFLAPIAILPERLGNIILFWLIFGTWVAIGWKFNKGNILTLLALVSSPMVISGLMTQNVDFLVFWGLFVPPELSILFFAIKPQVGGAAILYVLWESYRTGGWRKVVRVLILPTILMGLSFLFYGFWPLRVRETILMSWNASPFLIIGPWAILIGVIILGIALRRKDSEEGMRISLAASPFFSPFIGFQSWVAILPALVKSKWLYVLWTVTWGWTFYLLVR